MQVYHICISTLVTMVKTLNIFLALLLCSALPASAAGTRPTAAWTYYHFDGTAFVAGPAVDGSPFVAIRKKAQPVVLTTQTTPPEQTTLPDGTGVIAGICYQQCGGGKLGGGSRYHVYPHVPLRISSGGRQFVTVQTDDHGYFVAVLPAGLYSVGNGPFTAKITVEPGVTTLTPLRIGKRMVD